MKIMKTRDLNDRKSVRKYEFNSSNNSHKAIVLNKLNFGKIKNPEIAVTASEKVNIPFSVEANGVKINFEIKSEINITTASTVLAQKELSNISREEAKFKKDLFMEGLGELGQAIMTAYPIVKNELKSLKEESDKRSSEYNKKYEEQQKQLKLDNEFEYWKKDLENYLKVEDLINVEGEDSYEVVEARKWAKSQKKMFLLGLIEDKRIIDALKTLSII